MIFPPHQRGDLAEPQWQRLKPLLPAQKPDTGRPSNDHRTVLNGIFWVLRTGAPWRDVPEYGAWESVSGRFYYWRIGLWQRILERLQQQADADGKLNWEDVKYSATYGAELILFVQSPMVITLLALGGGQKLFIWR